MDSIPGSGHEEAAVTIARHAVSFRYDNIPADLLKMVKASVLDSLGVTLGASGVTPGIKELVSMVKREGGKKESTILGFGGKVPAYMAAFCNGAMSHALDFDDINDRCSVHVSSTVIPATLAVAELKGKTSGKDFLTAVVLGQDLTCRMGFAIKNRYGWHTAPVFGVFGATLSCGKLMNFSEKQYTGAFGVALSQSGTTMEVGYSVGSEIRGMYPAFSAKGAVLSARLAEVGVFGPSQSMEGAAGLYNTYFRGEYRREALVENLGTQFENRDITLKLWPTARPTHPYIDGALRLAAQHNLKPDDIEKIVLYVGGLSERCALPLEERIRPASTLDAKYSVPFCVSVALIKKRLAIQDVAPESISDPEVLAMAKKVSVVKDPEIAALFKQGLYPGKIELQTKRGQIFSITVKHARGHPENPPSREQLTEKFIECTTRFAVNPLRKRDAEKVIDMVNHLEELDDVSRIVDIIGQGKTRVKRGRTK